MDATIGTGTSAFDSVEAGGLTLTRSKCLFRICVSFGLLNLHFLLLNNANEIMTD